MSGHSIAADCIVMGRTGTAPEQVPVGGAALRFTRRGRLVLSSVALVLCGLLVVVGWGSAAATGGGATESAPATITTMTVAPGQTLWDVATVVAPERDPRDVIEALRELNPSLQAPGAVPVAGQELLLPTD